ncbi:hypothetical protein [uncultured Sphingomonas sp.]|uniref:hypothetical protein n=1 Tax=uncultured Sphingomonas sp. TaxID=158754 RepID=UPI003749A5EB
MNSPSGPAAALPGGSVVDSAAVDGPEDALSSLAGRERRLHARAYHHWASLLDGARFPLIRSLDPGTIGDFAANSVLLDFRGSRTDPVIAYIGSALRDECDLDHRPERIVDLPERSLLARMTGHCSQIVIDQAPAGFEAEFINTRGRTTLYRGILLPYSSDGLMIDFVHGVVSWKELADPLLQATLDSALLDSLGGRAAPASPDATAGLWAEGRPTSPRLRAEAPDILAHIAFTTGAEPGTAVVLAGHVATDGGMAVTGSVVGDDELADRVLRASH